jgi:TRAP-type C4-dicarboxylate transport system substrate-binding protein|tara:strand:- start:2058 stop:3113 length:1056 start_codon:yes stop_codon:yes gene_type:complete
MSKTPTKFIIASAAIAAAIGVGTVKPLNAAEFNLRMHSFIPPVANPAKTWLIPWAKKIKKASGGRVNVKTFWKMQLGGKPQALLDQVRDGVVDMVWTLPGFTTGRMPKAEIFELPFLHKDALSSTLALQDYKDKHLGKETGDFHVLLMHVHAGVLFMTKKPVRKMADLKGMKIRGANRTSVLLLQALGVDGIATPLGRIPPMLSKGVIDGVLLPYEIAPAVKMHELGKYFTDLSAPATRMNTAVFTFLMNKKSYAKLPAAMKKVIDDNSGRNIAAAAGKNWEAIEAPSKKIMQSKKKNKFSTLNATESDKIRKVAQAVYGKVVSELKSKHGINNGQQLIDDARAMIAKYSK